MVRIPPNGKPERLKGFDNVPGRGKWFGNGPPLGVRSLTATADGAALLAAVHVGGIPRSSDRGDTWTSTVPVMFDVHEVAAHPSMPNIVAAAAAVIYTSESESLAALETLVHIGTGSRIRFSVIRLDFDKAMVETLALSALSPNWKSEPPGPATKQLGDAWVTGARSAILAVPSVIIPSGLNYVLNPAHPDFSKIVFGKPKPFTFDPRLLA